MAYLELQFASQAISKYTTLKAYLPFHQSMDWQ